MSQPRAAASRSRVAFIAFAVVRITGCPVIDDKNLPVTTIRADGAVCESHSRLGSSAAASMALFGNVFGRWRVQWKCLCLKSYSDGRTRALVGEGETWGREALLLISTS